MSQTTLQAVKEAAFETVVLENGLTLLVHPMPEFSSVHAVYATHFGSIDRAFRLGETTYKVPAGIAHFLEHKMFENEDGDAFLLYAKTGANANAYTGFDKTCYVFTASEHIDENLDILLSFVSKPYFTAKTVEKEQGIIGQEIKMYDDAPEWRLIFGVYESLYQTHSLREDIAGTVESILEITPEVLYACTDAYYRPQNMVLAVAGNITMEQVMAACARAQIPAKAQPMERIAALEPAAVACPEKTFTMPIAKPMLGLGFKETPLGDDVQACIRGEMISDLLTELICGSMTPLYRKLYDESLITPGFTGEALHVAGASCLVFGGETSKPEVVRGLLLAEIKRLREEGVSKELFTLCKNQMYGELVADLETVDDVAPGMVNTFFKGRQAGQEIAVLAQLTAEDVNDALQTMLLEANSATVIIRPTQHTADTQEEV